MPGGATATQSATPGPTYPPTLTATLKLLRFVMLRLITTMLKLHFPVQVNDSDHCNGTDRNWVWGTRGCGRGRS